MPGQRPEITDEMIVRLYVDEELSGPEIAARFGWKSDRAVYHRLDRAGVARRSVGTRINHVRRAEARRLRAEGYSFDKIGVLMGCRSGAAHWLATAGAQPAAGG